jgi:surface antigen
MQSRRRLRMSRARTVAIGAVLALVSSMLIGVVGASSAFADTTLCSGYDWTTCPNAGYTDHGYGSHSTTSYWGAYAGHNCTNYVAYAESALNGAPTPGYLLGNGSDWDDNASAHGVPVDTTPGRGSVAQWEAGYHGADSSGHVAYVESANADGSITVSGDNFSSGPFSWRTIPANGNWPSHFIHFKDLSSTTGRSNLIVTQYGGGFGLAFGNPDGSLSEGPVSLTNWGVQSWAGVGDFNNDGQLDILDAQSGGGFAIAYGQTNGTFTDGGTTLPGWGTGTWAGTGNFYGDGRADFVSARASGGFAVAYGNTSGALSEGPVSLTNWGVQIWAGVGDFNGDGYSDILDARSGGSFAVALGHADGIFTDGGITLPGWGTTPWAGTGNFYGADSRTDLVVARASGGFAVAYGNPNGTLSEGPVSLTNWGVQSWAVPVTSTGTVIPTSSSPDPAAVSLSPLATPTASSPMAASRFLGGVLPVVGARTVRSSIPRVTATTRKP